MGAGHPPEHLVVISGLLVSRIGDVGQPRQRSCPSPQHLLEQRRQLSRQCLLSRLGHPAQVNRPQPPTPPVVYRNRRRRPFPITCFATNRQHQPVTTNG